VDTNEFINQIYLINQASADFDISNEEMGKIISLGTALVARIDQREMWVVELNVLFFLTSTLVVLARFVCAKFSFHLVHFTMFKVIAMAML
jgi:hypothetical protein